MAEPLVVVSFLPGAERFTSERYETFGIECVNDTDYWRGLASVWDEPRIIVNVEHDMSVDDDDIADLLDCKHRFCSALYKLYWPSTSKPVPHYAQRTGLKPPAGGEWVGPDALWADYTGIGFCKIAPECRVGALAECHWSHLDISVAKATVGRVHLHNEVEHTHW